MKYTRYMNKFEECKKDDSCFLVGNEGDTVGDAIAREGWVVEYERQCVEEITLARRTDGALIGVGVGPLGVVLEKSDHIERGSRHS